MAARASAGRLVSQGNEGPRVDASGPSQLSFNIQKRHVNLVPLDCARKNHFHGIHWKCRHPPSRPPPPAPEGTCITPTMPRGDRRGQRDAVTVTCEEAAGVGAEHRVCSRVIRGQCAFQLIVVRALTSPPPERSSRPPA